ncbi:MAG: hypothetical protein ABH823_03685 [bacterium]
MRWAVLIFLVTALSGQVVADGIHPFTSWLADPKTIRLDEKIIYSAPQDISNYDLAINGQNLFLFYRSNGKLLLTSSNDAGLTFSPAKAITSLASQPAVAADNSRLALAWQKQGRLKYIESTDNGLNFSLPEEFTITGESLSQPCLAVGNDGKLFLAGVALNPDTQLRQIIIAGLASQETRPLFETHDRISNLGLTKIGPTLILYWQTRYLERRESYFLTSLDNGATFGSVERFDLETDLLGLELTDETLNALSLENNEIIPTTIDLPLPEAPQLIYPQPNDILNGKDSQLLYRVKGTEPLLINIELQNNGRTTAFVELINQPSQETMALPLPENLNEGLYSIRLQASNGLNQSSFTSAVTFSLDNTPARIISLEAEQLASAIKFSGRFSETPIHLSINEQPIICGSSFEASLPLKPGVNLFNFVVSDAAGNLWTTSREVSYDPAKPIITFIQPQKTDWFKPESVIFIQAAVIDPANNLADESEASLTLDQQLLDEVLVFDRETKSLSGFVGLPKDLSDGTHKLTLELSQNQTFDLAVNIDGSPPIINQAAGQTCYSNSANSISVPATDRGAGLDTASTIVTIAGVSQEGIVKLDGQQLIFSPGIELVEGSYEVEVSVRDQIGNVGKTVAFSLVVDTTPPNLIMHSSIESTTTTSQVLLQGEVQDTLASQLTIYNNSKKISGQTLSNELFSQRLDLSPGNNEIFLEAEDAAGNKTQLTLTTFAQLGAGTNNLILNCLNGPNPFTPQKPLPGAMAAHGNGMVFSYALAQPADITIRIFDITGMQIWVQKINNSASGVTAWSGVDAFGNLPGNGIYPFIFSATADGQTENQKGKILIVN